MLRAHRQAWCWQDEWTDLTMEDIRQLEEETARMLAQKMAKCGEDEEPPASGISPEGQPEPGGPGRQEEAELQAGTDTPSDDTFAKQWSTSSRSSYSSQHGGERPGLVWLCCECCCSSTGDVSGDCFAWLGSPGLGLWMSQVWSQLS